MSVIASKNEDYRDARKMRKHFNILAVEIKKIDLSLIFKQGPELYKCRVLACISRKCWVFVSSIFSSEIMIGQNCSTPFQNPPIAE